MRANALDRQAAPSAERDDAHMCAPHTIRVPQSRKQYTAVCRVCETFVRGRAGARIFSGAEA